MARPRKGTMTKTEFVLGTPDTVAREVVVAATKAGIKLTDRYAYVIRSNANKKARTAGSGRGKRCSRSGAEADLRRAIAEFGLTRSPHVDLVLVDRSIKVRQRVRGA